MNPSPLTALSPLDGRYFAKVDPLREIFSEFGLIKRRIAVEVAWLVALSECPEIEEVPLLSSEATARLSGIASNFGAEQADRVKSIEATTNHDQTFKPNISLRSNRILSRHQLPTGPK